MSVGSDDVIRVNKDISTDQGTSWSGLWGMTQKECV